MSEPVIALNKLTKSYGKHRGIEEISFTVERGEIFGFIGPNGAGKVHHHPYLDGTVEAHRRNRFCLWTGLWAAGI